MIDWMTCLQGMTAHTLGQTHPFSIINKEPSISLPRLVDRSVKSVELEVRRTVVARGGLFVRRSKGQ